jgi:site-specific DNA recombinase
MGLRAGLYPRVSDDQDKTSRSVPQQVDDLRAACGQEGWRVVAEYPEPDRSASRFAKRDRPQWARLMADLTAGRLDVVVLWESSRGDRKLTGWSTFLDECRERGVLIHVTSHHRTYDLSIPREWRTLADEGVDSAYESEKTSMRIKRDLADAAQRGRPHGRLAYGYTRQYDVRTGKLDKQVPDPGEAPVAREIITRIASSDAVSAILRDLDARSVRTRAGGRWSRSSTCRLVLEGVVYIGKRRHNGGPLLDGDWPAIVDEDVYWRAVAVLSDPKRKPAGGGIRPGRSRWLLSYIAKCAVCGGPLSVRHAARAGSRQVDYYRCIAGHAVMPVDFFDRAVSEVVMTWAAKPGVYEAVMRRDDTNAGAARAEADAERARLVSFEEDAIAGRISSASFARIAAGIESRIAELEERTRAGGHPALRELFGSGSNLETIRGVWAGMPLTAQRHVVSALVAEPGYLRLRPSGVRGRDHAALLDLRRIELKLADDPRAR